MVDAVAGEEGSGDRDEEGEDEDADETWETRKGTIPREESVRAARLAKEVLARRWNRLMTASWEEREREGKRRRMRRNAWSVSGVWLIPL